MAAKLPPSKMRAASRLPQAVAQMHAGLHPRLHLRGTARAAVRKCKTFSCKARLAFVTTRSEIAGIIFRAFSADERSVLCTRP